VTEKRALVCSYYIPSRDQDSGSRRIFDTIVFLREAGWAVTFLSSNGSTDARAAGELQQRGVIVYDRSAISLEELLGWGAFQIAILSYWPIAEYVAPVIRRVSPDTRIIVDSIDLHFLRDARRIFQQPAETGARLLDEEFGSQLAGELNAYASADGVLTVSGKEADLIDDLTGEGKLAHNVCCGEDLAASAVPFSQRKGIVTIGSYGHPPNVEAVEYLCKEVLPLVDPALLDRHPVYVIGSGLDERVTQYGQGLRSVKMVGRVPSVTPYLERARISVVPLRNGAGTKRKLIQALMAGTPTVSTTIGVEGLDLQDGEQVLIADEPAAFAAAIKRLLEDATLWRRVARQGRSHILSTHSREMARKQLLDAITMVMAKAPKPAILPPTAQTKYWARLGYQQSQILLPRVRKVVERLLPLDATVLVVSEGCHNLLKLGERTAWHFPKPGTGDAEFFTRPVDEDAAIAELDAYQAKGAQFLLFPASAWSWFTDYPGLVRYLNERHDLLVRQQDVCAIYRLRQGDRTRESGRMPDVLGAATPAVPPATGETPQVVTIKDALRDEANAGNVRAIAFYLPQFHPIPENDAWWGEGFTEWTNVAKALPQFPGHHQPHLPADLGFYDLRLAETRQAQAELARKHGIHGFCHYHYWFAGKQLLERPFNEVLKSGRPDFPFCLCWANEPWSRRWNGQPEDVLQAQTYSEEDDRAHIEWLIPALADPRAIEIEGKPVFIVYQGQNLPEPARTVQTWREAVRRAGLRGIYLIAVETGWDAGWDATKVGFDAKLLFQPQFTMLRATPSNSIPGKPELQVYDYQRAWPVLRNPDTVSYRRYDCVFPGWDNSPRVGERAVIVQNSTPAAYEEWLRSVVAKTRLQPPEHRVLFINAWNEWGEGCHLEPDADHGLAYLEATARALSGGNAPAVDTDSPVRDVEFASTNLDVLVERPAPTPAAAISAG
jgi:glycosyltransferase involved in cell wall biosynthesis